MNNIILRLKWGINQFWEWLGVAEHSYCINPSWTGRCRCGWKLTAEEVRRLIEKSKDPNRAIFRPEDHKDHILPFVSRDEEE